MEQNTYTERLSYYTQLINPKNLFYSDIQIKEFAEKLASNRKELDSAAKRRLSLIVSSSLHPQTNEPIFKPFRMCSFVPTSLVVTVGLVLPNPSTRGLLFWHWMNQTLNVCINFSNANKSSKSSVKDVAKAYFSAVAVSITLALGLTQLNNKYNSKPSNAFSILINRSVPFASVASASVVNVALMRYKELNDGIKVYTKENQLVGTSKEAGKAAVFQVSLTRVLTLLPPLLIAPIIMNKIESRPFFKKNSKFIIPVRVSLIGALLYAGLPLSLAVYPQTGKLSPKQIQRDFPGLQEEVYFNKGL